MSEGPVVLTDDDLREVLRSIGVDAPVRAEEVTASTNATAWALADEGAPAWTLVTAAHQTAGRGRLGRSWLDVEGRALLCSVVLRPAGSPATLGLLPLLAGASMAGAIGAMGGGGARCKWPNDLLIAGAKVGGILAEARIEGASPGAVVLGAGVNLDAPAGIDGAGGIGPVEVRGLLAAYLERLHRDVTARPSRLAAITRERWLPVADTIGRSVRAIGAGGSEVVGIATGMDDRGGLVIAAAGGEVTVTSGEVMHLR